jgi:DNA integrity scanning protein DisA with diadenylate cyclase activity
MDAIVSARLIEQVFFKNSPLHDGAMLIRNGRIAQAAGVLPTSRNRRIPAELGLRHRSALGISEICDAQVVVVSEETGDISLCYRGRITRGISQAKLQKQLLDGKPHKNN